MNNVFYVYIHRKLNGEIFYVGKGRDKRAWSPHGRNTFWKNTVLKYEYNVSIIEDNLSESQAFELEEFLISYCKLRTQGGTLTNLTLGGEGISGLECSPATRKKISIKARGMGNGRSDKTIYTFVNFHTGEEYTGTRQDFTTNYSVNVSDICKNSKILTVKSWCLKENLDKITTPKCDCRLYNFVHITGEVITATRRDFKAQTDIDPKNLFKSKKYRYASIYGWCLEENRTNLKPLRHPNRVYTFVHTDGSIIQATRNDFKIQTGISSKSLFGVDKRKTTKGWSLKTD